MLASSWVARSAGGLDFGVGGGLVVECAGVLAGTLEFAAGEDTVGETDDELGEPPVVVQPATTRVAPASTTPTRRMPHILPAGHEYAPRRATEYRSRVPGLDNEDCRALVRPDRN